MSFYPNRPGGTGAFGPGWLVAIACNGLCRDRIEYPGPVSRSVAGSEDLDLADLLTWGAFTYPLAFLVNDLTNRRFGPAAARMVVLAGFALAVILSVWLATPRIAIASGSAFLVAQLLDVAIFNRTETRPRGGAPR